MDLTVNENKNLYIVVDKEVFERYAIKTHFVQIGESYIDLVKKYVVPVYQPGDFVALGAKVISLCQKRIVYRKDLKISLEAKILSKFAMQHTSKGIGVGEVCKMQVAIDLCGKWKVLYAAIAAGIGKLIGVKGIFYKICGQQVTGLDGFYPDVFECYGDYGILIPENCDEVCNEIEKQTGVKCFISDSNDFARYIMGKSDGVEYSLEQLAQIMKDNPSGQKDQLTPFILVRKKED